MTTFLSGGAASSGNPYSPTAVALISERSPAPVTVSTDSVRKAHAVIDEYLTTPFAAGRRPTGGVLTVVGDFGLGKTHLAASLWQRSRAADARSVYLDAPAGSFVKLHQRFVAQLDRQDVMETLRDYYADVVADDLENVPSTTEIARLLRAGEVDPVDVVRDLHLMDSRLLRKLQRILVDAMGDEIGTGLTLLLEPNLEAAVWDWLAGNAPSEFLRERGIVRQLASEPDALRAIAAFTRFYLGRNLRFVLVIDEFDKTLVAAEQLGPEAMNEFKRTLTTFERDGTFVVLSGLSDVVELVGADTLQRMGNIIYMAPMTGGDLRSLIRKTHQLARGDEDLIPFSDETIDYLARLTNGIPRQIIKLCHHLYRRYLESGEVATIELVHNVARDHFDYASVMDVRREIVRILHQNSIRFSRDYLRGFDDEPIIDFWVSSPTGEPRCAVLVTGSILTDSDVEVIDYRASNARQENDAVEIVLVIVGYLSNELEDPLRELLGSEPIEYQRRTFTEEFSAVVTAILGQSGDNDTASPLTLIQDRVDRISRQQARFQGMIEQLTTQRSTSEEAVERHFASLRHELADLLRRPTETTGEAEAAQLERSSEVLVRTGEVFSGALALIGDLHHIEQILGDAFGVSPEQARPAEMARTMVRNTLQQQDGFIPLGAAAFLRQLVEAFQRAVTQWYLGSDARAGAGFSAGDRSRLDRLCQSYDLLFQYLPLYQLKRLAETTARYPDETELEAALRWPAIHLDDIRSGFEELGVRIRATVLDSPPGLDSSRGR